MAGIYYEDVRGSNLVWGIPAPSKTGYWKFARSGSCLAQNNVLNKERNSSAFNFPHLFLILSMFSLQLISATKCDDKNINLDNLEIMSTVSAHCEPV